jgi:multisubunit Na+/H+ antiporter MnhB subunit
MNLTTTLIILALAIGIYAYGSWRAAKPADPLNPRLIPWRPIILIAGLVGLLMVVHLVNLTGFDTGANQVGARRFP